MITVFAPGEVIRVTNFSLNYYAKENEDTTIMWVEYDFQEYDPHSLTLF